LKGELNDGFWFKSLFFLFWSSLAFIKPDPIDMVIADVVPDEEEDEAVVLVAESDPFEYLNMEHSSSGGICFSHV
jgi:hypothetical protein